ncbi:MAG: Hsp20/alpha crystallin family protein [Cyanobacteria bacterium]|nr:Hsp20/alpha crystallin family protein [Cyanobacteriota bacterium]
MLNLTPWRAKRVPIHHKQEDHPAYQLQRELNRLFDDFFSTSPWDSLGEVPALFGEHQYSSDLTPRIDMSETDKEILVKVELPGMTEKDVDVSISNDRITISGEKKQEREESEKGWYRMERQYGSFRRSIPLPYETDEDKAEAFYKNGVLTIKLPKSQVQNNPKTISVKRG